MGFFSSGSAAVDAMGRIEISGNITPPKWYKEILRDNGKPYLLAIILLSDIVYWYRPVEVRDEATGNTIGWRKKFKSDLLQKTYEQYANQYGETKRTIKAALDRLEELGLIRKVFRDLRLGNGTKIPNVMFIELNPARIDEITHEKIDYGNSGTSGPAVQKSYHTGNRSVDNSVDNTMENHVDNFYTKEENQACAGYPTKFCTTPSERMHDHPQNNAVSPAHERSPLLQNSVGYPTPDVGTNTEIITENTTESTAKIIHENTTDNALGEFSQVMSGESAADTDEDPWPDRIDFSKPFRVTMQKPPDRRTDRERYIEMLKNQVEYDILLQDRTYRIYRETIDGIINIIADIATTEPADGYEMVNKRKYPHEVVKNRLLKMDYMTLMHVLDRLSKNTTEIRSLRNYLITALYNAKDEMDLSVDSEVRHDMYSYS